MTISVLSIRGVVVGYYRMGRDVLLEMYHIGYWR